MYRIPICPIPTPRPRLGKYGVYNEPKYKSYKQSIIQYLSLLNIPRLDYDYLHAKFYIPYPKSAPKKSLIDCCPLRSNFDCDNVIKGLMDALEQSNTIDNDRQISSLFIEKFRTTNSEGFIEFELQYVGEDE